METRNVTLTLNKAKEFYNSDNVALKEMALQAFTEEELKRFDFKNITTFKDACEALGISTDWISVLFHTMNLMKEESLRSYSKASIAMLKLNIIRQALNKNQKMEFTKGNIYYPYIPFVVKKSSYYNDELNNGSMIEVAQFMYNDDRYRLLSGDAYYGRNTGLGRFDSYFGVGNSTADIGFLGCASKEIAKHMSRYFAKEIFEAMYGDYVDFEWV